MTQATPRWHSALLPMDSSIEQAIRNLEASGLKIVMVTNGHGQLEGTITDGDIRSGLLNGVTLSSPIIGVVYRTPMVVVPDMGRDLVLQLMVANKLQQIPIVDENRQVVGLHLWDQLSAIEARQNTMVIMAGGLGTRLRPHTGRCPKPMLPVAGKPMLQHIIERAKAEGFQHFVISILYLGHMIEEHFGDGRQFGVDIEYLREKTPLGTAGALSLLSPKPQHSFVVTNGDVITDIKYGELLDFHNLHQAAATMAVRMHEWQHPFGVVQTDGVNIIGIEEKPISRSRINAGVYAFHPDALSCLPPDERCDMPTLFEKVQHSQLRAVAYPMHEPWLDVGRPEDLDSANAQMP